MSKSKLNYLFGDKCWDYLPERLHYVTPYQISQAVAKLVHDHYSLQDATVWDMFAGIGMDSVNLSRYAKQVISTEVDLPTYCKLETNCQNNTNITCIHADCCRGLAKGTADVVYFDPPWGDDFMSGTDFDFHQVVVSDTVDVIELLRQVVDQYRLVIVKSPYESSSFELAFDDQITAIYAFPKPKVKFLIIENKGTP